jgi:hypothetical protein
MAADLSEEEVIVRRATMLTMATALVLTLAVPALGAPGGNPGSPIAPGAIWADGQLFATVGLGSLPYNGNDQSFDMLFMIEGQEPVSEAGPGNPDYNGGRWLPTPVTWNTTPYLITSYADLQEAVAAGDVTIGDSDTGAAFLCPLIPNH